MSEDRMTRDSLMEQLYGVMFARLGKRDEFNLRTVQNLHHLAREGKLNKAPQIVEAIKEATEREP